MLLILYSSMLHMIEVALAIDPVLKVLTKQSVMQLFMQSHYSCSLVYSYLYCFSTQLLYSPQSIFVMLIITYKHFAFFSHRISSQLLLFLSSLYTPLPVFLLHALHSSTCCMHCICNSSSIAYGVLCSVFSFIFQVSAYGVLI